MGAQGCVKGRWSTRGRATKAREGKVPSRQGKWNKAELPNPKPRATKKVVIRGWGGGRKGGTVGVVSSGRGLEGNGMLARHRRRGKVMGNNNKVQGAVPHKGKRTCL